MWADTLILFFTVDDDVEQLTKNIRDMSLVLALKMLDKAIADIVECEYISLFFPAGLSQYLCITTHDIPHVALMCFFFFPTVNNPSAVATAIEKLDQGKLLLVGLLPGPGRAIPTPDASHLAATKFPSALQDPARSRNAIVSPSALQNPARPHHAVASSSTPPSSPGRSHWVSPSKRKLYVVLNGREVGVFSDWYVKFYYPYSIMYLSP
jgi:hypothetical protein